MSLKTNWYQGCGCCDDSRSCEHLKKHVTDKYLTRFSTLLTFCYKKFMLLLQYLSDWFLHAVCLTEIPEEKHLILRDHLNQIYGPLATLSSLQHFGFFSGPQLPRQLPYKNWLGASGPNCHLTTKLGYLQKTKVAFKS